MPRIIHTRGTHPVPPAPFGQAEWLVVRQRRTPRLMHIEGSRALFDLPALFAGRSQPAAFKRRLEGPPYTHLQPVFKLPPVWSGIPSPTFVQGTASSYSLVPGFASDPNVGPVTLSLLAGTLPNGVTLNNAIGALDYDGVGPLATQTGVRLRATAIGGIADSAAFSVAILTGSNALAEDWTYRSTGPGVVWAHDFRSDAEVDLFRWTSGYGGGNDPLALGANALRCRRLATDGIAGTGGGCLEQLRPAGLSDTGGAWWRPFSAVNNNGRGIPDPAASGTVPVETWAPTDGGSQTSTWGTKGVYGHSSFAGPGFDGTEFYLQMRVKMDPRRSTGGNENVHVGKLFILCTHQLTQVSQEIVTYSGATFGGAGAPNYHRVYVTGAFTPLEDAEIEGRPGQQVGSDLANYGAGVFCDVTQQPGPCVAWSGGWDTILYHWQPGRSGVAETRARIYFARENELAYTKIWDATYSTTYEIVNGFNALVTSTFQNNANMPQEFWHRYTQKILSKNFVPRPIPTTWAAPTWFIGQTDKTWATPLTNWLGASGVKDPLADTINAGGGGHDGIIDEWTGMLSDPERRTIAMIANGGHNGYFGNEAYECNLSASAPAWVRKRDATNSSIGGGVATFADGRPRPDHSAQTWMAACGRWLKLGMETDINGSVRLNDWWEYDLFKNDYRALTNTFNAPGGVLGISNCTVVDRKRGHLLRLHSNAQVPCIVKMKADTLAVVEQANAGFQESSTLTAAIDTTRDLLLVRYPFDPGSAETFEVWQLNPLTKLATLSASGSGPSFQASLHYHKASDAFITWSNGSSVYKLKPTAGDESYSALTWSTVAAIGGPTPPNGPVQGMYTKVNYIEDMGNGQSVLIVVPAYQNPDVFVFKLPATGI